MVPTIQMMLNNWLYVWTAGSADEAGARFQAQAIGTLYVFGWVYAVYIILAMFTKSGPPNFMMKALPYILGVNAFFALGPIVVPVLIVAAVATLIYRHYNPPARQPAGHPRHQAPEHEEEDDHH